jgi:hypothetical protein
MVCMLRILQNFEPMEQKMIKFLITFIIENKL